MNRLLPSSFEAWAIAFDPHGLRDDEAWLEKAEPGEDILQLVHVLFPKRLLDVGYYGDRYRVVVIEDLDWDQPVDSFESESPHAVTDWIYSAIDRHA